MRVINCAPILASLCLLISPAAALAEDVQFSDLKLYTSHRVGGEVQRYTPKIGDKYQVTLKYAITGTPGRPVYYFEGHRMPRGPVSLEQKFNAECRSVRVNADLLRAVSWQDRDEAAQKEKLVLYAHPEMVIESEDHAIASFVRKTLGSDYREKLTPYDAGRKIFQAAEDTKDYSEMSARW